MSFDKAKRKYIASINRSGVKFYLGTFSILEDAVSARANHEAMLKEMGK